MKTKGKVTIDAIKNNRKLRIFVIFFGLSSFFWFLTKLSHNYNDSAKFSIEYINLPKDKVLLNEPAKELYLTLNAQGFRFLSYQLKSKKIKVDLSKLKKKRGTTYYYLPNQNLASVASDFDSETKIYNFDRDTIFIELGQNAIKKIKVKPAIDIDFKIGYDLSDKLIVDPDSIKIYGPKKYLDTIDYIATEVVELSNVSSKIEQEVLLEIPENNLINFSETKVVFKGEVEKFTEETVMLPIKIVNKPDDINLTIFPKEVKLVYKVGLTNYKKISNTDFVVVCDYANSINKNIDYLEPTIQYNSVHIKSIKIYPKRIDYLIKE